jgi:hypothetical protein
LFGIGLSANIAGVARIPPSQGPGRGHRLSRNHIKPKFL